METILDTTELMRLQKAEIDSNYEVFQKELPKLMKQKLQNQYALLHERKIFNIYKRFDQAISAGTELYGNKPFSVQEITTEPVHLGIYSSK